MSTRKVLVLTYHFPPSGAVAVYRLLGLVRYLPKYGWEPVVVAPPSLPGEPLDGELAAQVPPETAIYRVPYPDSRLLRRCGTWAPHAVWLLRAGAAAGRAIREHRPAALLTSSPPHRLHLLGRWLSWRHRLPWIADFRDPLLSGKTSGPISFTKRRLGRRLERTVLRHAAAVVANAPEAGKDLGEAHPGLADKIVIVPNGFDPEDFAGPSPPAVAGPLLILHAGELYDGRDPRGLLDALQFLAPAPGEEPPFRLRLLGQATDPRDDLAGEIRRRGLQDVVEVRGQVPHSRALEEMRRADILLLVNPPQSRTSVPAKVYEYLGAGRPILALARSDGDVAWALRTAGGPHRIVAPLDSGAIREALLALRQERLAGTPAAAGADSPFTRERMARRVAVVLDGCCLPEAVRPSPLPFGLGPSV